MRITILNQFYTPDLAPTAHLCASLANHLAARGHEVRMVTSRGGYVAESASANSESRRGANPRVHRLWTPRLGKKRHLYLAIDYASFYLVALLRMVLMPRQDVVVTLTTPPLIGLAAWAHKVLHWRTRVVLWNMDCYPDVAEVTEVMPRGGLLSRFFAAMVRFQFRSIDHLVTLDSAMSELLLNRYAGKRKDSLPVTVVPNWESRDLFPEPELNAPPATPEQPFVVLYLGNAGFGHRFDTVIEAASRLRDDPIRFLFVGGGRRWEEIETAAREAGLENLEMRGYIPKEETPALIASAGCALITLRDDNVGIMSPSKLHSNLAVGLPIVYVGPAKSNVDEAIARFGCGAAIRHGEVDRLVDALRSLANDPEARLRQRRDARRAFDECYNDSVTLPQLEAVITGEGASE